MALWMPMTRPCMSNSGPPESPGLIVQSVCSAPASIRMMRPSRTTSDRRRSKPPGWPSASTQSPMRASPEIAHLGMRPGAPAGDPHEAGVVLGLTPTVLPRAVLPLGKVKLTSRSGAPQTCPAVSTRPSAEMITPLPLPAADFNGHHRGRHARGQGFHVPLHGSEVVEGDWHILGERGAQIACGKQAWAVAPPARWSCPRRQPFPVAQS